MKGRASEVKQRENQKQYHIWGKLHINVTIKDLRVSPVARYTLHFLHCNSSAISEKHSILVIQGRKKHLKEEDGAGRGRVVWNLVESPHKNIQGGTRVVQ